MQHRPHQEIQLHLAGVEQTDRQRDPATSDQKHTETGKNSHLVNYELFLKASFQIIVKPLQSVPLLLQTVNYPQTVDCPAVITI